MPLNLVKSNLPIYTGCIFPMLLSLLVDYTIIMTAKPLKYSENNIWLGFKEDSCAGWSRVDISFLGIISLEIDVLTVLLSSTPLIELHLVDELEPTDAGSFGEDNACLKFADTGSTELED